MRKSKKIITFILIMGMISANNPYVHAAENDTEASTEDTNQEIYEEKIDRKMDESVEESSIELTTAELPDLSDKLPDLTDKDTNKGKHGGITMTYDEFMTQVGDNKDAFQNIDNDTMFNMMKNSLDAGEDISLGEAFSMSEGLEIPSNFIYDLSETGLNGQLDASSINLQYANLITNMNLSGNQSVEDLSKNTVGAVNYFNSSYGDLADQLKINQATLPDGFDFTSICQNSSSQMSSAYGSLAGSSEYNSIRSRINVSSLFDAAAEGLSQPDLLSFDDLEGMTGSYDDKLKNNSLSMASEGKNQMRQDYLNRCDEIGNNPNFDVSMYANGANASQNYNDTINIINDAKERQTADFFESAAYGWEGEEAGGNNIFKKGANLFMRGARNVADVFSAGIGYLDKGIGWGLSKITGNEELSESFTEAGESYLDFTTHTGKEPENKPIN